MPSAQAGSCISLLLVLALGEKSHASMSLLHSRSVGVHMTRKLKLKILNSVEVCTGEHYHYGYYVLRTCRPFWLKSGKPMLFCDACIPF